MRFQHRALAFCVFVLALPLAHAQLSDFFKSAPSACLPAVRERGINLWAQSAWPGNATAYAALERELNDVDSALGTWNAQWPQWAPHWQQITTNGRQLLKLQKTSIQAQTELDSLAGLSNDLQQAIGGLQSAYLIASASPVRASAASQLTMLSQRLGKSAAQFFGKPAVSPEAVFLLGKDVNSFKEILEALQAGNPNLRIAAATDAKEKAHLASIQLAFAPVQKATATVLGSLQDLVAARQALARVTSAADALDKALLAQCQSRP